MEGKYLGKKFIWRKRTNNHYRSKKLGFPLFLQPLFSLTFYFIHLSSELNSFFHLCLNNTLIFCYLDSKTLTKLWFFNHVQCKMSTQTISLKVFFTKFCFYPYPFPQNLHHVTLCENLSSIFQFIRSMPTLKLDMIT